MTALRIVIFSLCLVSGSAALAHGGGLDSYGCHNNRKQGGYHCHRGPLAGQSFESKEQMLKEAKRPLRRRHGRTKFSTELLKERVDHVQEPDLLRYRMSWLCLLRHGIC